MPGWADLFNYGSSHPEPGAGPESCPARQGQADRPTVPRTRGTHGRGHAPDKAFWSETGRVPVFGRAPLSVNPDAVDDLVGPNLVPVIRVRSDTGVLKPCGCRGKIANARVSGRFVRAGSYNPVDSAQENDLRPA